MSFSRVLLSALCLTVLLPGISMAQPQLPEVGALTKDGINVLSWINPYKSGVSSVSIERSADSTFNYQTIGVLKNISETAQSYIDTRPMLGDNWYRVVVLFTSGTDWKSNVVKLHLDSADVANRKPLPPGDSLQKLIDKMPPAGSPEQAVNNINTNAVYPKSKYVFTNPFTGNIDIDLADASENDYSLYFYDEQGKEALFIPRINDTAVILDRRNFQKPGVFKFKLLKNKEEFATGYVAVY
ncbi:MAG TPA: hypothetical protein VFL76_01440 [Edaphocola sp.]|nr:hypothetical protein [Edaphocola sp.]